jgi:hypothetical protein
MAGLSVLTGHVFTTPARLLDAVEAFARVRGV